MTLDLGLEDRYRRLKDISWWKQSLLKEARILVVGAGALGNEILKNLALVGVGHIAIADFDKVEMSNLTRSVLFRASDVGAPKANASARRVREINDEIQTVALNLNIENELGIGVVRRMDLVLAGLDNVAGRMAVNRLCRIAGKPWIDGGLHELDGLLRFFHPDEGACYECGLTDRDYGRESRRYSCQLLSSTAVLDAVPTSPTSAATIGAWQVQEALKWLHGLPVLRSEMVTFIGQSFETRRVLLVPRKECPGHEMRISAVRAMALTSRNTVDELLRTLREILGEDAAVHLRFDIVTSLSCAHCRRFVSINRALHVLRARDFLCPVCGLERTAQLSHEIDAGWPEKSLSLESIGVPELEVLRVKTHNGDSHYFELAGDACGLNWRKFFE